MNGTTRLGRLGLHHALLLLALVAPGCRGIDGGRAAGAQVQMVSTHVSEGAPCDAEGDVAECHSTTPVTGGGGREICLVGERRCEAGRWGACAAVEERAYPLASQLDQANGVVHQPVVGSSLTCPGCDTTCHTTTDVYNDGADDLADDSLENDGCEDAAGVGIRIGAGGSSSPTGTYAWVAHTWSSLVSKVHLTNRTVDGQYRVGINGISNTPSRTAVDGSGNAFVAQRALWGGQGTLTKIAGSLAQCEDLNGDGDIDTSNGTTLLGWPGTASQDECVLWQVPVGSSGSVPRALTIDQLGRVWVGLHNDQAFVVIDGETGDEVGTVSGLASCPYGAVTDSTGRIWASSLGPAPTVCGDPGVQWIDGTSAAPSDADVGTWYATPVVGTDQVQPYGVTIDGSDRLFMGDYAMGGVIRFDPASATWDYEDVASVGFGSSGATYHKGTDRVFISHGYSGTNLVTVHDPDTLDQLASYNASTLAGISSAHGLAPDFNGNIWMGAMGNSRVGVLDPVAGTIASITVPNSTYTYSDFTGYSYAVVVATTGGFYRTYDSAEPCLGPASHRTALYWTATMPAGASISFLGASATDDDLLPTAEEVNLGSTSAASGSLPIAETMIAEGEDPSLQYFRLHVVLHRGEESPVIERLSIQEYCP